MRGRGRAVASRPGRTRSTATACAWGLIALLVLLLAAPAEARGSRPSRGLGQRASLPSRRAAPPAPAEFHPDALAAASVILVDHETGEILYAHAARERRSPASLTKVMTAIVVLEKTQLTDQVVVGPTARDAGGSTLGLRPGQRASVRDLLAALLIKSANDAAVALAEHVGGSVAGFAALMNAKAQALGMRDSHFQNPHGLDAPDHYASAYDLALLTRYALQSPVFAQLVRARQEAIRLMGPGKRRGRPEVATRIIRSHNRLLGGFDGADGVKTGFTSEAGRCLVASAQRDGKRLIAVLLNDPRRWDDAASLLQYGFTLVGAPAGTRAPAPGGLAPPPRVPDDPEVGG